MSVESYHGTAQSALAVGPTHERRPVHLPLKDHCDVVVAVLNDINTFLIILQRRTDPTSFTAVI